jgi:energy-coupling factor transport system ATP-binding protein
MDIAIEVKNLCFKYSTNEAFVLNNINMSVKKGSLVGIIGLSGCGKSTLANAMCGIIPSSLPGIMQGSVIVDGMDTSSVTLARLAHKIGIVFQEPDYQLFLPTVEEEIAFGPENLCVKAEDIVKKVEDILNSLNIVSLRYRNPSMLSGGEKRIVALGTVLSMDPDTIIMDEPFSDLDETNRMIVSDAVLNLKKAGKTIIIIEHDLEYLNCIDKLYVMDNGAIVKELEGGSIDEFLQYGFRKFFI